MISNAQVNKAVSLLSVCKGGQSLEHNLSKLFLQVQWCSYFKEGGGLRNPFSGRVFPLPCEASRRVIRGRHFFLVGAGGGRNQVISGRVLPHPSWKGVQESHVLGTTANPAGKHDPGPAPAACPRGFPCYNWKRRKNIHPMVVPGKIPIRFDNESGKKCRLFQMVQGMRVSFVTSEEGSISRGGLPSRGGGPPRWLPGCSVASPSHREFCSARIAGAW